MTESFFLQHNRDGAGKCSLKHIGELRISAEKLSKDLATEVSLLQKKMSLQWKGLVALAIGWL